MLKALCENMIKYLVILISLFASSVFAEEIQIEVDDCGPLRRGDLGVVFSPKPRTSGVTYFTKGSAMEVCVRLTTAKSVIGYEEPYCKNYKPVYPHECESIKVFVIKEYIFE